MIHVTRRRLADFSCAIALSCVVASAHGQDYPARPVRFIVPFASGTFDLVARTVAQKLSEIWGQQVVVDNRPGGATIIATELTAKSSPDGYTMYLSPNALAANPALHKKLPYAQKDLAPVLLVAAQPMALGAHPSFVANTIRDLIGLAKAKPGAFAYGTAGIGSGGYLAGEIFKSTAGIDLIHVSYKSGGLAMTDVLGNQIPLVMTGLPNLLPHHKTKRLKILAITDGSRSPVAQDIPTIGETVPGYEFKNWFGVLVASGTPRAIVQKINADINKVLGTPDTRQKLIDQGFIVIGGTSEEFAKVIKDDTARFADIIRRAGIKPN